MLVDGMLEDLFGYCALQLGDPHRDMLRASPIAGKYRVGRARGCDALADYCQLPFASATVDLIVICHVLEFSVHPEVIIRESFRVLRPEGRLMVIGFNASGPYGLQQRCNLDGAYPFFGRFVSIRRLKDWFAVLGLTAGHGCYLGYTPPLVVTPSIWWKNMFEQAGDRWCPTWGGVYILQAIKRLPDMRRLVPKWKDKRAALRRTLPARVS